MGIRAARGDLIVHFDSDDWSGPDRISHQAEWLSHGLKVVGYSRAWWYDTRNKLAAYPRCGLWGASLCYERQWALDHPWDEDRISCEDAWFLEPARSQGVSGEMEGGDNFVALAHGGNTMRPFGYEGWGIREYQELPAGFRQFMEGNHVRH